MQATVAQKDAQAFWDAKRDELSKEEFCRLRDETSPSTWDSRLVSEERALNECAPKGRMISRDKIDGASFDGWVFPGDVKYLFEVEETAKEMGS